MTRLTIRNSRGESHLQKIAITPSLKIPMHEVDFRFSRSGGKGGQNVNKVETKVELLFDVKRAPSLGDRQRALLFRRLASRLDAHGVLHIVDQSSRSQWKNRQDAVARFADVMRAALTPPKRRIATRPSGASKELRLMRKKRRGILKRSRHSDE